MTKYVSETEYEARSKYENTFMHTIRDREFLEKKAIITKYVIDKKYKEQDMLTKLALLNLENS